VAEQLNLFVGERTDELLNVLKPIPRIAFVLARIQVEKSGVLVEVQAFDKGLA